MSSKSWMLALVLIVSGMCFKLFLLSRGSLSLDMPSIDNLTAGMGDSIAGHIVKGLSDTVSNTSKLWLEEAVPVANGSLLPDDGQETWDVVVVGAGLAGAVIADLYAHSGKRVLVLEKRGHIGGSCYDARDADSGILASMHGIRVLATNQEQVWRYVHRHGAWEHYEHRAAALPSPQPGARLVPFSVNIEAVRMLDNSSVTSVESMREWGRKRKAGALSVNASNAAESLRDIAGEKLYGALLKPHLENVWGVDPSQLEASVSDSVPASWNWDDRYFPGHQWQGVPREGYTRWFERALGHPRIKVMLDTDYYESSFYRQGGAETLASRGGKSERRIFISGGIDAYFRKKDPTLPKLSYRRSTRNVTRRVKGSYLPAQPTAEIELCGSGGSGAVRDVEYKHIGRQAGDGSFVVREGYESCDGEGGAGAEMIVPLISDRASFDHYTRMADAEADGRGVFFVGSLSRFEVPRMDATISDAMRLFERLEGRKALEGALRRSAGSDGGASLGDGAGTAAARGEAGASPRRMLLHVAVSLYDEDIGWIKDLCENGFSGIDSDVHWFIYLKNQNRSAEGVKREALSLMASTRGCSGGRVTVTRLPNLGREGHTWLTHLFTSDFCFGDVTVFFQGGIHAPSSKLSCFLKKVNSSLFMNGRATRASADVNLVNDIRVIDKETMMGDRMRNGYVNCAPREGEGLNPMWHMMPFGKLKLGNGLDRLTRRSPRGTMLKYFRLLGKPYGFYTSGKHLFFYRAEFIVTEALIRRLLQRHRSMLWDTVYPDLAVSSAPFNSGQSVERFWYTFFVDQRPNANASMDKNTPHGI